MSLVVGSLPLPSCCSEYDDFRVSIDKRGGGILEGSFFDTSFAGVGEEWSGVIIGVGIWPPERIKHNGGKKYDRFNR